ncbi:MAG: T9SS type A sorting domain-containing protein [Calditrichaeota bacterium]|nr:T9SS type A sorting domain-containing protein [Calditrichota bacterium]
MKFSEFINGCNYNKTGILNNPAGLKTGWKVVTFKEQKKHQSHSISRDYLINITTLTANNLPSGLYFVRMKASEQVFTQKVMLIR